MCYQVFYMMKGETKTYLSTPTTEADAHRFAEEFDKKYYNKPYPNGKGVYPVSRAWVGRV